MKPNPESEESRVAHAAAEWVLRHERGLSAAEQDEFSAWLAANPLHGVAFGEGRWGWEELDRLVGLQTSQQAIPDPDLLKPKRRARPLKFVLPAALAFAAALAVMFFRAEDAVTLPAPPTVAPLALIEERLLPDGSKVELNRGAELRVEFTATERRVVLVRGEANFDVAKDPARPFVVWANGVAVRAIGTRFNVRLDPASVEVLVTEGRVAVNHPDTDPTAPLHVTAGNRTVVSLAPAAPAPQVTVMPPAEIEARLAWQPRLLDFNDSYLGEIVAEFNRRNPVRLVIGDEALRELRLSATFRSDNVEGFVRLMESDFGMRAERRLNEEIVLQSRP